MIRLPACYNHPRLFAMRTIKGHCTLTPPVTWLRSTDCELEHDASGSSRTLSLIDSKRWVLCRSHFFGRTFRPPPLYLSDITCWVRRRGAADHKRDLFGLLPLAFLLLTVGQVGQVMGEEQDQQNIRDTWMEHFGDHSFSWEQLG